MNRVPTPADESLLDLHLGLLEVDEARRVEAEIDSSESLAAKSVRLSSWLKLLNAFSCPAPPARLVDSIMDRVAHAPSFRLAAAASTLPPATDWRGSSRPVISLRELVALAAVITFLVSVVVPGFATMRTNSQRAFCQKNLAGIYQGFGQYARDFNGSLPQTAGFVPGANWLRSPAPGVPRMPNRRNLFLVVRLGYAQPNSFICPSVCSTAKSANIPLEKMDDFPSATACGFDFQNTAGPTMLLGQGGLQPIVADRNPLFDNEECVKVLNSEMNSRSHDGGSGQNVLSSGGDVGWVTSPVVAPKGDNMWQVEGIEHYTGTEVQQRPDDAFIGP